MGMTTPGPEEQDAPARGERTWLLATGLILVGLAVAVAWHAGAGAPAQPEMFAAGGSCQVALCGELEDPVRWRASWWTLAGSVALALAGFVAAVKALPVRELDSSSARVFGGCLVVLLLGPVYLATMLLAGFFMSPVPFAVVLAALPGLGYGTVLHVLLFRGPASQWSVVIATAAAAAPLVVVLAWWQPWTLG